MTKTPEYHVFRGDKKVAVRRDEIKIGDTFSENGRWGQLTLDDEVEFNSVTRGDGHYFCRGQWYRASHHGHDRVSFRHNPNMPLAQSGGQAIFPRRTDKVQFLSVIEVADPTLAQVA